MPAAPAHIGPATSKHVGCRPAITCTGPVRIPARFRRKLPPPEKLLSAPEEAAHGAAGGGSAPETPEQVFTPKQDRHGSRSLDEVQPPSRTVQSLPCATEHVRNGQRTLRCKGMGVLAVWESSSCSALPADVYSCTHMQARW